MQDAGSLRGRLLVVALAASSCNCEPRGAPPAPAVTAPPVTAPVPAPVATPAALPAPIAPASGLVLEPQASPLVDGRLRVRLPAGASPGPEATPLPPPISIARETVISFGPADQRLGLAAFDALRLAGPDLAAEARQYLGSSAGPRFDVRTLDDVRPPLRAVLAIPDRLVASRFCSAQARRAGECETDETFVSAKLLVAQADGMVQVIDLLCDESSCPRPALQALAVELAATLEPGPNPLVRAAGPRGLFAFQVDVPADFVVSSQSGADYDGLTVERLVPLAAPSGGSFAIRSLGDRLPSREDPPAPPAAPIRLFGQTVQWTAQQTSDPAALTRVYDCMLAGHAYSFRLTAANEQGLADLGRMAESTRILPSATVPASSTCVPRP